MRIKRPLWTEQELALLREHYPDQGATALLAMFPHRSREEIARRARTIGLFNKAWTTDQDQMLRDRYPKEGSSASLTRDLGKPSRQCARIRAHRLGIPAPDRKREGHPSYRGVGEVTATFWCRLRRGAKHRGLSVEVDKQYIWDLFQSQKGICALSGMKLVFPSRVDGTDGTASVDRIDSSVGYVKGNLQWVHKDINYIKRDLSDSEFIEYCRLVAANHL